MIFPRVRGVGRMADNERAILLIADAKPTDDELRALHDHLRRETTRLSEDEIDEECERILAMSNDEVRAELTKQGQDPDRVALEQHILVRNAITITRMRAAIQAECHRLEHDWNAADVATARRNLLQSLSSAD